MIPLRLEPFGDASEVVVTDAAALEDVRREARAAGRAEAEAEMAASAEQAEREIAETLSRSLQDMAFAWHGAREQMMQALDPLLRQILNTVLPPMAAAALAPAVADAVLPLAQSATGQPLRLLLHPEDHAAILPRLPDAGFPLVVQTDAAVARGSALIADGLSETLVDPAGAANAILAALDDFFTLNAEVRHG
ncbi:hypothetical protein [Falsirhodobacter deserti]|uniref:hypothetical protein n=1 Tax=Falsirhodobacter deserti TaxID=1365611 RepID=UPI000FE39555|nr:hypothetical protein [Falsirhodobacter deserti]